MVSRVNRKDENGTLLYHYIDSEVEEKMLKRKTLPISSINAKDIRIGNKLYLTDTYYDNKLKILYNQNKTSKVYDEVYTDPILNERVEKIIGKNVIMVRENKKINDRIIDTLIYEIDPETFEVVTPIWSDLQRRFIDVHPLEEIRKLEWEKHMHYPFSEGEGQKLISRTIRLEILRYLDMLAEQLSREDIMYKNELPNKEFMMKLTDKN